MEKQDQNKYKIIFNSNISWDIFNANNFEKVKLCDDFNPTRFKLFTNDVFTVDQDNDKVKLIHSIVKSGPAIPGVLILSGNKSYGKFVKDIIKNANTNTNANANKTNKINKSNKLLYKCIPDDTKLPSFLIPYEIKHTGFSKVMKNLYVTFNFNNWDDKHPHGRLDQVIGEVDIIDSFYEYQLYCKGLNEPINTFQKETQTSINNTSHDTLIEKIKLKYPSIEDRTHINNIITIDPNGSTDFDDGFSITETNTMDTKVLSIYISNVTIWMDFLQLWDSFSRRISTIYLPNKKRPMLPTILTDCLCSLQENVTRVAFVMDIYIQCDEIIDIKYNNCLIKVFKNYRYEEEELLKDTTYLMLLETVKKFSAKFKYINNIENSHDVVSYLMIFMNYQCATQLLKRNTGIFRSTIVTDENVIVPTSIPENVAKFIKIWKSTTGQYVDGSKLQRQSVKHDILNIDAYIHITSPIRRLIDILNIIKFQQALNLIELTQWSQIFYNKWLNELEYINTTMRSIRKLQCDCNLLDLCENDVNMLEKLYDGYVFDRIDRNDGLYQYVAFINELKISAKITIREKINNFECCKFKLFLFNDEERFKKKIRLQIVPSF